MAKGGMDSTELLHILVEGLTGDLTGVTREDIPGLMNAARTMKELLFPRRELDTHWDDPYEFLDALVPRMNGQTGVGALSYERLSDKRMRITIDDCGPAKKIHRRTELGPVCPKLLLVAAMVMAEFPRRKVRLGHSIYSEQGASSDLVLG